MKEKIIQSFLKKILLSEKLRAKCKMSSVEFKKGKTNHHLESSVMDKFYTYYLTLSCHEVGLIF